MCSDIIKTLSSSPPSLIVRNHRNVSAAASNYVPQRVTEVMVGLLSPPFHVFCVPLDLTMWKCQVREFPFGQITIRSKRNIPNYYNIPLIGHN